MYTRPYDERSGIVIPESYGGTALYEKEHPSEENETQTASAPMPDEGRNPWEKKRVHTDETEKNERAEPVSSFLSKLPFGDFLEEIFVNGKIGLQKIGIEEILIVATAAFLFFSKEGDKECAIMLMLLLFLQ